MIRLFEFIPTHDQFIAFLLFLCGKYLLKKEKDLVVFLCMYRPIRSVTLLEDFDLQWLFSEYKTFNLEQIIVKGHD
jgi:hypothetical protein